MKKILLVIATLCVTAFLLAGCGESKPVEEETTTTVENDAAVQGTWTEDYFDSGYTFNADGTGTDIFWNLPFTYTAHDGLLTLVYEDESFAKAEYLYSVGESDITMTLKSDSSKSYSYHKTN